MRSVLFVDPAAFCTTVEGLVAPALRTRPVAVAPPGADHATILALSAEARLAGVERGMPVRQALKRCPDLVVLPPNPRLYARASRALHEVLRVYAPVIEPRGYGHAFLDLTGTGRLFGPAVDVAARVQREVRERLRLPVSLGIAANKLVSEAATTVVKPEPLLEVPGGAEASFLAPHPLDVLPELHPRMRRRLEDYQLDRIGEVAAIAESALCAVFGGAGRTLRARARGIDPRPVLPPERQAEFHVAHALATDTNDLGVLHPLLRVLGERLGRRLRRSGLVARRLRVSLTYADHTDAARTVALRAAALDTELWDAARRAFTQANARRLAVRGVALTLDRLEEAAGQLELWEMAEGGEWECGVIQGQVSSRSASSHPERSEASHPERSETSHPERSEGDHAGLRPLRGVHPLRFAQGDSTPGDSTPGDSTPGDSTPGDSAPGDSAPGDSPPRPSDSGAPARSRALQHALDRISTRYGARALTTGAVRALTR
jgi:DNA polymerase-4